ncbi:diguanylate cyclase (GGDEF) domain-containing protein [Devosia lucknowensis]|uniref:diguanylate cyclase n=1 Tax=Devosia lucknowensis TaxID=1096929 RepID=A0A1Y6EKT7_9HYPH|nr:diguanylate cyclase [Devosia lucknowensis]SMQ62949.1 diguanylate cyclase (GGDEF) domain-containing protein [Devosia lucknowensis]
MLKLLKARSLRFWVALGMVVALAPLTLSAVIGHFVLNGSVISAFDDVAKRQRSELGPLQDLRILVWDTLIPIDEYVNEGGPQQPLLFRELRSRIETGFVDIRVQFADDADALLHLDNAFESWEVAQNLATTLTADALAPDDPEAERQAKLFHANIAATSDRLGQAFDVIQAKIAAEHDAAVKWSEDAGLVLAVALGLSLVAVVAGVVLVGLIMSRSVDRLVDGAARFANGDRDHRIDISVPPELSRVALEFNRMIARIDASETALAGLARVDELTQLLNRRAFDEALARLHAGIVSGSAAGALLTLDIDHFKAINDTHGHAAGDAVLRSFAATLRNSVRAGDQLYRIGGEEFAIILAGAGPDKAVDLANRLREAVSAQPIPYRDVKIPVTVSVGAAMLSGDLTPAELLEAADAALYKAKTDGRNRVVLSS